MTCSTQIRGMYWCFLHIAKVGFNSVLLCTVAHYLRHLWHSICACMDKNVRLLFIAKQPRHHMLGKITQRIGINPICLQECWPFWILLSIPSLLNCPVSTPSNKHLQFHYRSHCSMLSSNTPPHQLSEALRHSLPTVPPLLFNFPLSAIAVSLPAPFQRPTRWGAAESHTPTVRPSVSVCPVCRRVFVLARASAAL